MIDRRGGSKSGPLDFVRPPRHLSASLLPIRFTRFPAVYELGDKRSEDGPRAVSKRRRINGGNAIWIIRSPRSSPAEGESPGLIGISWKAF